MDMAKLGQNIFRVGIGLLVIALIWWTIAYMGLPEDAPISFFGGIPCIIGGGIECILANAVVGYSPVAFWLGAIALIAGYFMSRSAKKPAE